MKLFGIFLIILASIMAIIISLFFNKRLYESQFIFRIINKLPAHQIIEKLYSTIGFRRDEHTTAGEETTGRVTIAYKLDNNTKIRSSFGTGIRFPTLYDYFYGDSAVSNKEEKKKKKSKSFDIGYETNFEKIDGWKKKTNWWVLWRFKKR